MQSKLSRLMTAQPAVSVCGRKEGYQSWMLRSSRSRIVAWEMLLLTTVAWALVAHVEAGDAAVRTFKVQCDESKTAGKRLELGIACWIITVRASPYAVSKPVQEHKIPANNDKENIRPTSCSAGSQPEEIHAILTLGNSSNG
jgi:hypothetical protein